MVVWGGVNNIKGKREKGKRDYAEWERERNYNGRLRFFLLDLQHKIYNQIYTYFFNAFFLFFKV